MSENLVSTLNCRIGKDLNVGLSHPKTMSEMTKVPWKTMKIWVDPGKEFKLCSKKELM